jgi:hypothetical protein
MHINTQFPAWQILQRGLGESLLELGVCDSPVEKFLLSPNGLESGTMRICQRLLACHDTESLDGVHDGCRRACPTAALPNDRIEITLDDKGIVTLGLLGLKNVQARLRRRKFLSGR